VKNCNMYSISSVTPNQNLLRRFQCNFGEGRHFWNRYLEMRVYMKLIFKSKIHKIQTLGILQTERHTIRLTDDGHQVNYIRDILERLAVRLTTVWRSQKLKRHYP
jgi:hypothetical protein